MIKYSFVRHRDFLNKLNETNRTKEVEKIEKQLREIEKRKKVAENCRKVRETVSKGSFEVGCRTSVRNENENSFNIKINTRKVDSQNIRVSNTLKTQKDKAQNVTFDNKKDVKLKPKWALSKKEHTAMNGKDQVNVEDFMDKLDFNQFLDQLEDQILKSHKSELHDGGKSEYDSYESNRSSFHARDHPSDILIDCEQENVDDKMNISKVKKLHLDESMIRRSTVALTSQRTKFVDKNTEHENLNDSKALANYIYNQNMNMSRIHSKRSIAKIIETKIRPQSAFHV